METLFIYLIKSSGLLSLFYLSYVVLLRKETFFNSNRWFLLAGLITSIALPLVVFTKIVWVDPSPSNFDWSKIPMTTTTPIENETFEINWYLVFTVVYSIGILGFLVKFALDFYSLSKVLKGKIIQKQANFKLINVSENIAPFSYFNSIVYNSSLYTETELENILEHEKVHSKQNHTADVLVSRLFCIIFWFHPLVWLYKKAIVQNLEFIADCEASKNISDKKAYQLTLLKITTQENCVAITNHFYQSLIKKRIVMLNKNQSNKRNSWKYAVVLPLLGAFLFFFQVKVVAQEKESVKTEIKSPEIDKTNLIITKNTTDEEIKEHCEQIKKRYNIDLTFFNIKRNSNGEIINIESKYQNKNDGGSGSSNQLDLNKSPIKPFKFLYNETKKETGYINMDLASVYKGKEIIVNGKVVSQDELAKLNPNEIKSIAENTKNGKPTIEIDTKNAFKPVKITDKDIYIDGVKVTNEEFNKLNQSTVDKVDVNTFENTVRITTKTINRSLDNFEIPIPPTPPTPPAFTIKTPKPPVFPKAPKSNSINGDKKAWKEYESKMKDFNKKMKAFEKQMEEFDKQIKPFNTDMEAFNKKKKIYEQQMQEYEAKIESENRKKLFQLIPQEIVSP
ncbi:M56 family metallopeptidase [Flavobacterium eburneipallidum]|uniref:M56 family metallopeptidase n=1 Tax=Flavobacterium eburneipallidum TaxID=3003263 RepID=UPI00248224AA|nr:M56 family metallopeptidase [Flavobacterium eburneipallidum]